MTAAYLAACADRGLKASTVTRRVAAIRFVHKSTGHEPPTNSEPVKAVLRGVRRELGTSVERKAPATAETVARMLRRTPNTLVGCRDRALIALGFAGAFRRSELVGLNLEDIERRPEGIVIHLRRSKTDQEGAGREVANPRWIETAGRRAPRRLDNGGGHCDGAAVPTHFARGACASRPANRQRGRQDRQAIRGGRGLRPETLFRSLAARRLRHLALERGADIMKVMDVTGHTQVQTLKAYDRRAKAFKGHAGAKFL